MTIGEFIQIIKPLPKDWNLTVDGKKIIGLTFRNNYLTIDYNNTKTYDFIQSKEQE